MKTAKPLWLVLLLLPVMLVAADKEEVLFKWALVIRDQKAGTETLTNNSTVELTHELYKFIFSPAKGCYIYLFSSTGEDELSLIFPPQISFFDKGYAYNRYYDAPAGKSAYYTLEEKNPGTRKFYLLASKKRLNAIDNILAKGNVVAAVPVEDEKIRTNLLNEILRLVKSDNPLTAGIEKPEPISGVVKTGDSEVYVVSGTGFYARIIRITGAS